MLDVISGARDVRHRLPGVSLHYAWLPPWEGLSDCCPNRAKVVFSEHERVALEHAGRHLDVSVHPGGVYVMGEECTRLQRVSEHSETLDMYPDLALLRSQAAALGLSTFCLDATLGACRRNTVRRDPVLLGLAARFRHLCVSGVVLTDVEASTLANALVHRLIVRQAGPEPIRARHRLGTTALQRVCQFIEDRLSGPLSLEAMAKQCHLSTWHFARQFRAKTGLPPWQYVLHRRMELAKRLLQHTTLRIEEVTWEVGAENVSHFRRQFRRHVGVTPGAFRDATVSLPRRDASWRRAARSGWTC